MCELSWCKLWTIFPLFFSTKSIKCLSYLYSVVPASQASGDQTSRSNPGSTASPSPVLMSFSSFALLVTPVEQDFPGRNTKYLASPLQRFFDALYLIKHLVRVVRNDVTVCLIAFVLISWSCQAWTAQRFKGGGAEFRAKGANWWSGFFPSNIF